MNHKAIAYYLNEFAKVAKDGELTELVDRFLFELQPSREDLFFIKYQIRKTYPEHKFLTKLLK